MSQESSLGATLIEMLRHFSVAGMRFLPRTQEADIAVAGRKPQQRLTPRRLRLLANRRIAREGRQELNAFPPGLLAISE